MKYKTIIIAVVALLVGVLIGSLWQQSLQVQSADSEETASIESPIVYDSTLDDTSPVPTPTQVKPYSSFGDGLYEVNVDIKPGLYKTDGIGESCYYVRLSSLTGGSDNIIDNELVDGPATVEVLASDKGFKSSDCGTWKLVE